MEQLYRDHQRTEMGTGYPVPPPKPLGDQAPPLTGETNSDAEDGDDTEDGQDRGSYDDADDADGERDTDGEEDQGAAAPTLVATPSQPVVSSSLPKPMPDPTPGQSAVDGLQPTQKGARGA